MEDYIGNFFKYLNIVRVRDLVFSVFKRFFIFLNILSFLKRIRRSKGLKMLGCFIGVNCINL